MKLVASGPEHGQTLVLVLYMLLTRRAQQCWPRMTALTTLGFLLLIGPRGLRLPPIADAGALEQIALATWSESEQKERWVAASALRRRRH
jgi:hypothetical protein